MDNVKDMYSGLVKEALDLVDYVDVSDQFSNLDIEMGSTILQKERTKRSLDMTHKNLLNEIERVNKNNKELGNSLNEYKHEIEELF
jgi:hypothetical protein